MVAATTPAVWSGVSGSSTVRPGRDDEEPEHEHELAEPRRLDPLRVWFEGDAPAVTDAVAEPAQLDDEIDLPEGDVADLSRPDETGSGETGSGEQARHRRPAAGLLRRFGRGRVSEPVEDRATAAADDESPSEQDLERLEAERLEAERVEAERLEAERLEAERLEAERVEAERLEAERVEAERLEAEQAEAERVEAERLEAERVEAERLEAEQAEAEQAETERVEAERLETEQAEAEAMQEEDAAERAAAEERAELERVETEQAELEAAAEAARAKAEQAARREDARRAKDEERERRQAEKAERRAAKARAAAERRRGPEPADPSEPADDVPEPPDEVRSSPSRSVLALVAGTIGALGLLFSVLLAAGALLVAVGVDESGALFSFVSTCCDVLTAPISGLVSFSGENADKKEALVTWGLGSMAYLVVGLVAQSVLRARTEVSV